MKRLLLWFNAMYLVWGGMHWKVNDELGQIELVQSNFHGASLLHRGEGQKAVQAKRPGGTNREVPLPGGKPLVAPPDTSSWYMNGPPELTKGSGEGWAGTPPAKSSKGKKSRHPEPALAVLFERYGGVEKALIMLRKSTVLNPNDPVLWSDLGNAHRVNGDTDEAILCFENALRLQPHPDFFLNLGGVRFVLGELDEAIRLFTLGLQMNPRHVLLQFSVGNAFAVLGRKEDAARSFEATLRIQPDFAAAEQYLRNLRRELQGKWWPASTLWFGGCAFVLLLAVAQRTVHYLAMQSEQEDAAGKEAGGEVAPLSPDRLRRRRRDGN
mmetsp:Transcript_62697/g.198535  ORF Transcript_62697/g.198535 Transcript_62697/m.198535 type:complete len:325 (-) Transcript_62697:27-1001(-)